MIKIIKNGKFFGILNLLDIGIIFFILVIILPMLHYYIKFNEKGIAEQRLLQKTIAKNNGWMCNQTGTIDVHTSFKNIDKMLLDEIKVGDKEILPDGTILAEILWIGAPQPNYFMTDLTGIQAIPDKKPYSLPAKLRLRGIIANKEGASFVYKMDNLRPNIPFVFDTEKYTLPFVIELNLGKQTGTIDTCVAFKNITKATLDKIQIGDKEILPDGTVLAKILWIGDPQPNYFVTNLKKMDEENIIAILDGNFYSLPAKVRLRGRVEGSGIFTYKMKNLRKGSSFAFDSNKYAADFIIEPHLFKRSEKGKPDY
jgi:hypothetical protein